MNRNGIAKAGAVFGIAIVATTLLALAGHAATRQPASAEPPWSRALRLRSEGLELHAAKAATARFHSFTQAERAGYTIDREPCVASPAGAMGIHAVNPALLAEPGVDPLRPEMLLYVPRPNGRLSLVGLEYWQASADQTPPVGSSDRPSLFGRAFDGPMEGHAPGMPYHYDLHVWFWAKNPAGLFAMFNPALSCP